MKHIGPISGIACHENGYIATAGYDNQVILWDGVTREPIARGFHDHLANQCAFSPDGKYLVSSSSDYSARLWSTSDMRLVALYHGHSDDIEMSAFHPTGKYLATCSRDNDIRTFELDGTSIARLRGHVADVISVGWVGDTDILISSSDDGTVRRWNGMNGKLLETIDLGGIETDTIVITSSGTIFAGNDNGDLLTIKGSSIVATSAHRAGIKRLAFSEASQQLVSLSYDRKIIIWKVASDDTLVQLSQADLPPMVWPRSVAFQSASKLVFGTFGSTYATYDRATETWEVDHVEPDISLNTVVSHDGRIYAIGDSGRVHCDGKIVNELGSLCNFMLPLGPLILTGGQIGTIYDAITGTKIHQHHSPLNTGATFTRNGEQYAIIGAYTGEGIVFRLTETGEALHVTDIQLDDNAIKGIACSDDLIFSVCATGAAAYFKIEDFSQVREIVDAHDKIANSCTVLPSGQFVSVSRDLKLRIWKGDDVEVHPSPLRNSIKCVAASTDGKFLAAGSYGGQVAIFDVLEKSWKTVQRPTASGISSIASIPDAAAFLASSYDGGIYEICT